MPKRKATTQLSGLVGSDDEDVIQMNGGDDNSPEPEERAVKRARGRPAKSAADRVEVAPQTKSRVPAASAASSVQDPAAKKKRGRPKGSGTRALEEQEEEPVKEAKPRKTKTQSREADVSSDDMEVEAPKKVVAPKTTKAAAKDTKAAAPRGRKKASAEELEDDDEEEEETRGQDDESDFEYTPRSQKVQSPRSSKEHKIPETQQPDPNVVEESFHPDLPASRRSISVSPSKADRKRPSLGVSPSKRKAGDSTEPELRRKIGDLTRKCETLEHRYRSLKEIGVAEATSNVAKLTKQCDTITAGMFYWDEMRRDELAEAN